MAKVIPKIADLPRLGLNSGYESQFSVTTYCFEIAIIRLYSGFLSWRGVGQSFPQGSVFVGNGLMWFGGNSDVVDEWPLEVYPLFAEVPQSVVEAGNEMWDKNGVCDWGSDEFGRVVSAQFAVMGF